MIEFIKRFSFEKTNDCYRLVFDGDSRSGILILESDYSKEVYFNNRYTEEDKKNQIIKMDAIKEVFDTIHDDSNKAKQLFAVKRLLEDPKLDVQIGIPGDTDRMSYGSYKSLSEVFKTMFPNLAEYDETKKSKRWDYLDD